MGPHTIRNPEVPAFGTSKASNRPYAVRGQRFSHTASTKDSAEYGIASWYGWTLASNPAVAADQDLGISRRYGDAVQSLSLNYITPAIPDAFKNHPCGHDSGHVDVHGGCSRLLVHDHHRALLRQCPCKSIHTAAGVQALKGSRPHGWVAMSQGSCPAVESQKVMVPLALVLPGKGGAAEGVFGGAHADLIAVVNGGRARHGHLAEHAQAEGTLLFPH